MQPEKYALILAAFRCGSETPAPSGGAANYAARAMAFPHALRYALAFAVLRGVAAHEAKACRGWGHPKEGKWQKDEDCCAGVQQAACAAGYRYVKGEMCHKEVECKASSYECELCQPGET